MNVSGEGVSFCAENIGYSRSGKHEASLHIQLLSVSNELL